MYNLNKKRRLKKVKCARVYKRQKGDIKMAVYSTVDTVDTIANFFLSKSSMSHKKLQKLVYYAYAWTLTILNDREDDLNNKLFNNYFEGWVHGPVCPTLYKEYKICGWNDIAKKEGANFNFPVEVLDVLEQVWASYGQYTGIQLEDISHQEEPWKESRKGLPVFQSGDRLIRDETIYKYYTSVATEGN